MGSIGQYNHDCNFNLKLITILPHLLTPPPPLTRAELLKTLCSVDFQVMLYQRIYFIRVSTSAVCMTSIQENMAHTSLNP